jgi:hypothetical protein
MTDKPSVTVTAEHRLLAAEAFSPGSSSNGSLVAKWVRTGEGDLSVAPRVAEAIALAEHRGAQQAQSRGAGRASEGDVRHALTLLNRASTEHECRAGLAPCKTCDKRDAAHRELESWIRSRALPESPAQPGEAHDVEGIAARVHGAWMRTKLAAGVESRKSESGEELMVPYEQLSEAAKEMDRASVRAVLAAMPAARPGEASGGVVVVTDAYQREAQRLLDQEYGPSNHPADPGRAFTVTFTTAPYGMQVRELALFLATRDAAAAKPVESLGEWAVRCLDAWADAYGTQWHCGQSIRGTGFFVCRLMADGADPTRPKDYIADSANAARVAAAVALAYWDHHLPQPPLPTGPSLPPPPAELETEAAK